MNAIRAWDLSSGVAASYAGPRPAEIAIAQALPPLDVQPVGSFQEDSPPDVTLRVFNLDVWGMGRLVRIEESHFFKRSSWFATAKAGGSYDTDNLTNTPGHGYTVTVKAFVLVKDAEGIVHVIGELPAADIFLNGGIAPDGTEPLTGAQGLRFQFSVALARLEGDVNHAPAWDLVAYLEAIPETRIGCGDIVAAHAGNLSASKPAPIIFYHPTGG